MTDEMRVSYGFPLRVSLHTDMGRVRTNNEDSHGFAWLPDGSLFVIVADGMGGHDAGEVASGLAVQVLEEVVSRDLEADPRERLYNGLLEANEAILQEGRASKGRAVWGRRLWLCCAEAPRSTWAWWATRGCTTFVGGSSSGARSITPASRCSSIRARCLALRRENTPNLGCSHARLDTRRWPMGVHWPDVPRGARQHLTRRRPRALQRWTSRSRRRLGDRKDHRGQSPSAGRPKLVQVAIERGGHDNITVAVITAGERTSEFEELPNASPQTQNGGAPGASSASQEAVPSLYPVPSAQAAHAAAPAAPTPVTPVMDPPAMAAPAQPIQTIPSTGLPALNIDPDSPRSCAPVQRRLRRVIWLLRRLPHYPWPSTPPRCLHRRRRPWRHLGPKDPQEELAPTSDSASIARKTPGGLFFGLAAVTIVGLVVIGVLIESSSSSLLGDRLRLSTIAVTNNKCRVVSGGMGVA